MPASSLPVARFSTADFPAGEGFARWREAIGALYEAAWVNGQPAATFSASAASLHLGPLILGQMQADALAYERPAAKIRADRLDHFILGLDLGLDGGAAPAIVIQDLAQPVALPAMAWDGFCIVLPRDLMALFLPDAAALHGQRLQDMTGGLLVMHVRAILTAASRLTMAQAPALARATQQMIAACLAPLRDSQAGARPAGHAALIARARRLIDRKLGDADLSAAGLATALGLSRSALYDAFSPFGGVARYIAGRRLDRIHAALADPAEQRRIAEIADDFGFASEAHFSRAFRRRFGYTATEIRGRGFGRMAGRVSPPQDAATHLLFSRWIGDLD